MASSDGQDGRLDEPRLVAHDDMGGAALRLEAYHQSMGYHLLALGPKHRLAAMNQNQFDLLGSFTPGQRLVNLLGAPQADGVIDMFDRAYRGETVIARGSRFAVVTTEGGERELNLDMHVMPLHDATGAIIGTIAHARDVTAEIERERAQQAADAELARRFERARDVTEEVQRALLPSRLPVLPGVDVAATYVVGEAEQAAGGDWFEVVPRRGGAVAAVVGDVVGHGVTASAVMTQLRAVTLERLHAGASVTQVVEALDRFVQVAPGGRSATICVLELQPDTGEVEYCGAGHPPPLILDPEGESRYLPAAGEGLIGGIRSRTSTRETLHAGQVLLLYSDGIIERPGVDAPTGSVDLHRIATAAARDELLPAFSVAHAVDRVTTQTLERATLYTGTDDDITLLALEPVPRLQPFRLETDLDHVGITGVRTALRDWLRPGQVDPGAVHRLEEIVTELAQNALDHAYDDGHGPVAIDADLRDDGTLALTVGDRGTWTPPSGHPGRGLGLALVRSLSDTMTLRHGEAGTRVHVEFRPWKDATGAASMPPRGESDLFDVAEERLDGHAVLWVSGPVDTATVARLSAALTVATAPGRAGLTVDLHDVTVLCSAAVHALRETLEHARNVDIPVTLRAHPGSVAHHALTLAGLPTQQPPRP